MRKTVLAAGVLFLSAVCAAQTASAPAVEKPDYSTAIAAFKTFARAVVAQDSKGERDSIAIDAADKPTVDAVLGATEAAARLYKDVRANFGEAGLAEIRKPGTQELKMAAWLKMVDAAPTKIVDGRTIFMFPEGPGGLPKAGYITLESAGGSWKVTAASVFGLDEPAMAKKLKDAIPLYTKMAAAYNDVAVEVEAGKHSSVKSVQDSLIPKVAAIFPDTTSAATQK